MSEAPKRPGRPKKRVTLAGNEELADLRRRADAVNKNSRARVPWKLNLKPEIYRRLVEIAEQECTTLQMVGENALADGLLRWGEFSRSKGAEALAKVTPMRAYAKDLASPLDPTPGIYRRTLAVARDGIADFNASVAAEADPGLFKSQKREAMLEDLSSAIPGPGSPPLPRLELAE
jgi:hypothetical protein